MYTNYEQGIQKLRDLLSEASLPTEQEIWKHITMLQIALGDRKRYGHCPEIHTALLFAMTQLDRLLSVTGKGSFRDLCQTETEDDHNGYRNHFYYLDVCEGRYKLEELLDGSDVVCLVYPGSTMRVEKKLEHTPQQETDVQEAMKELEAFGLQGSDLRSVDGQRYLEIWKKLSVFISQHYQVGSYDATLNDLCLVDA
jgi:hypothetical protein